MIPVGGYAEEVRFYYGGAYGQNVAAGERDAFLLRSSRPVARDILEHCIMAGELLGGRERDFSRVEGEGFSCREIPLL